MSARSRSVPPAQAAERLRRFARVQVRAGLLGEAAVLEEVADAAAVDVDTDDPVGLARRLVAEERAALRSEQQAWPRTTDYDRLQAAFADLVDAGVVVLQGVDDHWSTKRELERLDDQGLRVRGIAWFTAPDVWHAVEHGMLEVNLWHGDTANAAPGDALLDDVLAVFAGHELPAHFDEGRIEVAASWQYRLDT